MGYAAAAMAALLVLVLLGVGRRMRRTAGDTRVLGVTADRIWVDRPAQSMPRAAVQQVRVDTYTSYRTSTTGQPGAGGSVLPRLLIESTDGRLELIGGPFERRKLEWIRDYLRHALAAG